MIEIIPNAVDAAFIYFHTRQSTGDEIAPFLVTTQAGPHFSPQGHEDTKEIYVKRHPPRCITHKNFVPLCLCG